MERIREDESSSRQGEVSFMNSSRFSSRGTANNLDGSRLHYSVPFPDIIPLLGDLTPRVFFSPPPDGDYYISFCPCVLAEEKKKAICQQPGNAGAGNETASNAQVPVRQSMIQGSPGFCRSGYCDLKFEHAEAAPVDSLVTESLLALTDPGRRTPPAAAAGAAVETTETDVDPTPPGRLLLEPWLQRSHHHRASCPRVDDGPAADGSRHLCSPPSPGTEPTIEDEASVSSLRWTDITSSSFNGQQGEVKYGQMDLPTIHDPRFYGMQYLPRLSRYPTVPDFTMDHLHHGGTWNEHSRKRRRTLARRAGTCAWASLAMATFIAALIGFSIFCSRGQRVFGPL
ncbi:unnamed protein product [Notodromas monacha]|uniref:Uncharacterized protein n=1 Tax=Notodromas monacha TaxID=399045 RepID=A0A7R9BE03_9CRUS|nr:unnamed protein product [Notodromas monacha]CAG0912704.1 unnamed protein product [Notodromas monacha]